MNKKKIDGMKGIQEKQYKRWRNGNKIVKVNLQEIGWISNERMSTDSSKPTKTK